MKSGNTSVSVVLHITSNESRVRMETDEGYQLTVNTDDSGTQVHITAHTYFGARHGLETLSQLISYDELTDSLQMHAKAIVKDKPQYVHRGLLIDTSRNFFSIDILKGIQKFNIRINTSQWCINRYCPGRARQLSLKCPKYFKHFDWIKERTLLRSKCCKMRLLGRFSMTVVRYGG